MDYFTVGYPTSDTSSGDTSEIDPISIEFPLEINALLDQFVAEDAGSIREDMWFQWDQDCLNDMKIVAEHLEASKAQDKHQETNIRAQSQTKRDGEAEEKRYHRRKAQNRTSQRLFRERKLQYVKGIEAQLEELNEKYQDLLVSFKVQADDNAELRSRIAKLNNTSLPNHSWKVTYV
ncbi:hypothetical protein B0A52_04796 [Exophiala mesophila]|uniref:BZIP domain-containing protein n=1 Tax=Exophiala mesophila TaxID=212818 RepID=A0A438N6H7_EXOME|nr:hypothetical protein B0A52_04796 [Exophiala mesophila]